MLTLPQQIAPASLELRLTPGTYSELVQDTLGPFADPDLPALSGIDDYSISIADIDADFSDLASAGADVAISSAGLPTGAGAEMYTSLQPALDVGATNIANFDAESLAVGAVDVPTPPPPNPEPVGIYTFTPGSTFAQGDLQIAAAGKDFGGTPNSGEDITQYATGAVVGTQYQVGITNLDIGLDPGGRFSIALDPSTDPSITIASTGEGNNVVWVGILNLAPVAAGYFYGRIIITVAGTGQTLTWGLYYHAT